MGKLKVLYVCHGHPSLRPGGAEAYALELYQAMRDSEEFQPTFLAKGGPPVSPARNPHAGTMVAMINEDPNQYFIYTDGFDYDWMYGTCRNKEVYTKHLSEFLASCQPDIIHIQHTAHIGFDLIRQVRNTLGNVPILYTLHEFLPICYRSGQMLRVENDEPCLESSPRRCHECFPDTSPQTFYMRKRFIHSHFSQVDLFLAPSQFLLERYVDWGISRTKIRHEEYGRLLSSSNGTPDKDAPRNRLGYFGQLSLYKGVNLLLQAMEILARDGTTQESTSARWRSPVPPNSPRPEDMHLWIHGANLEIQPGSFQNEFRALVESTKRDVTFLGRYVANELKRLMQAVDWVVVPSIWWENSPLVIQEAFAHGRPVLCSDIGGMAEKVRDGVDGLHFRAGNPRSLAETITRAVREPGLWRTLHQGIRPAYAMKDHVAALTKIYRGLLESKKVGEQLMRLEKEKIDAGQAETPSGQAPQNGAAVETAWVDCASWLSENYLLLVGGFALTANAPVQATLVRGPDSIPLALRHRAYQKPGRPDSHSGLDRIMLAELPNGGRKSGPLGQLVLSSNGQTHALWPRELSEALTDLRTVVRDSLAWLSAEERAQVLELVASAPGASVELRQNLAVLRDALRERLPSCVISADCRQSLYVDAFAALDETSFYIRGWMHDGESELTELVVISPEGSRAEILGKAFRHRRPDVEHLYREPRDDGKAVGHGFISYFELDGSSYLSPGWIIELRNPAGSGVESIIAEPLRDQRAVRDLILSDFAGEYKNREELRVNHILPALSRLQERQRFQAHADSVTVFGTPPHSPQASVIIPLYKKLHFLEHQLAQFVHDPLMSQADLIYVLDSPEQADALNELATHLFALYQVPFRLATLAHNVGFSGANNVGASLARADLLLLLNSDILPDQPGWLERMAAFYRSRPGIGALGAKLLFEDESIQHAGLYFSRLARSGEWENLHYFKGMHRSLPAANVTRAVPAVTAACLMIDRTLYHDIGGLRGIYIQGDYEDSDLCLRLSEQGLDNWYLADVELYHLEGQSYDHLARSKNCQYNRWLHTRLWGERIQYIMKGNC